MNVMVMYNSGPARMRRKLVNICLDYGLAKIQTGAYIGTLEGKLKRQLFGELRELSRQETLGEARMFDIREGAGEKIA